MRSEGGGITGEGRALEGDTSVTAMPSTAPPSDHKATPLLKRLGLAGFLFFLIKGLLWLTIPALLVFFGC